MAMSLEIPSGEAIAEINTTPLIDVMLVLLTLLIITLPMQTNAVNINLPHPGPPPPPLPVVMLEIDFDGSAIWNGWHIDQATLDSRLASAARQTPKPEIHLMANRLAKYNAVIKVMAHAERLGLTNIGLVDTQAY